MLTLRNSAVHTDAHDENEAVRAWTRLLYSEGVDDRNGSTRQDSERTYVSTVIEPKLQVDHVVQNSNNMKEMVVAQAAYTPVKMVIKEN